LSLISSQTSDHDHIDHTKHQMNHFKVFADSHFMSNLKKVEVTGSNANKAMAALLQLIEDYCDELSSGSVNQQIQSAHNPDTGYSSGTAGNTTAGNGLDLIESPDLHL